MKKNNPYSFEYIEKLFDFEIGNALVLARNKHGQILEIRVRMGKPIILCFFSGEFFLNLKEGITSEPESALIATKELIHRIVDVVSDYSLYAYEDSIRQGFITIRGGHRVGVTGKVVLENGRIRTLKQITFLNIRVASSVEGCGNIVLPYIYGEQGGMITVLHTLIISPPGGGKTTLLRDMIRLISDGNRYAKGISVGVCDERSEIAACYQGVPQNDVGVRTDVLDGAPKASGMMMLLRSMNPKVIAVDEIGGRDDMEAIQNVIRCGCGILATVHGNSIDDIRNRPGLRKLIQERVFQRYIVLSKKNGVGTIESIFDERGNDLYMPSYCIAN